MFRFTLPAVVGLGLIALALPARALTIDPNLYCTAGSDPTTNSDTTGGSKHLNTLTDLSLTINSVVTHPINCYGDFLGTNGFTPDTEAALFNQIFGTPSFPYINFDTNGSNSAATGIQFTVTETVTDPVTQSGTVTVTWSDVNGTNPPNLPIEFDFGIMLRGNDEEAAYLFAPILLGGPGTDTGTFKIDFPGSNSTQHPIAQINTIFLDARIPEPASMLVLGAGVLGLGALRRRRAA